MSTQGLGNHQQGGENLSLGLPLPFLSSAHNNSQPPSLPPSSATASVMLIFCYLRMYYVILSSPLSAVICWHACHLLVGGSDFVEHRRRAQTSLSSRRYLSLPLPALTPRSYTFYTLHKGQGMNPTYVPLSWGLPRVKVKRTLCSRPKIGDA